MPSSKRTRDAVGGRASRRACSAAILTGVLGLVPAGAFAQVATDEQRAGGFGGRATSTAKAPAETPRAVRAAPAKDVAGEERTRPLSASGRDIVGGTPAPIGAYPFFVSVQTTGGIHFCGGTLVSTNEVVTAAHCVESSAPADLRVRIGADHLSAGDTPSTTEFRNISQIIVHPSWNPSTFANDVAILRLSANSTHNWARIADPGDPTAPGQTVRAIGHGATAEGGTGTDELRQVDLPIQSDATMSSSSVYGSAFIGSIMIGAGPLSGGQDTCQGDSGGPLFISSGVQYPLVGDTSWGFGCARPNKPGVYGEVFQGALRTFVNTHVSRPANNNFPGTGLSGATGRVLGSNTDATNQPGEPGPTSTPDTTVWYSWTAPASGPTTFNLEDAGFDTALAVFTGTSIGGLTLRAANDDYVASLQSKLTFNATGGTTYRIQVDGFGAAHGPFALQWAQNPPANDDLAGAEVLSGATGKAFGSNTRATGEPGEPNHANTNSQSSVWFRWTAPENGTTVFNTREASFDTELAVYTGSGLNTISAAIVSNDDATAPNRQSRVVFTAVAGTEYRIALDGFGTATGSYGLQWSQRPPANDQFEASRLISGADGSTAATTVRSTGQPGELDFHGGAVADNSVWFRWTPAFSDTAVLRLLRASSGFSPGIEVYTGSSILSLTTVAEGSNIVTFPVTSGTTYRIAVDGNGGSTGSFVLDWVRARCDGLVPTIIGSGAITGTAGADVILGSSLADSIAANEGADVVCARNGNDSIADGAGNDRAFGGGGNDTFNGASAANGTDLLSGDTGTDKVSYALRTTAVRVDLTVAAGDGASGENDSALVENADGGSAGDTFIGSAVANAFAGNGGNDTANGGLGNDALTGGTGNDTVRGQDGNDRLHTRDSVSGNDTADGGAGTDTATVDSGDTVIGVP